MVLKYLQEEKNIAQSIKHCTFFGQGLKLIFKLNKWGVPSSNLDLSIYYATSLPAELNLQRHIKHYSNLNKNNNL